MRVRVDAHTDVEIDATARTVEVESPWRRGAAAVIIESPDERGPAASKRIALILFGRVELRPHEHGVLIIIEEKKL